jgi:geranylgeranyl diphosphate synthase type I
MQLDEFQAWFNKGLFEYIDARIGKYEQFTKRDAILDSLAQVRALARGGKRIRPYLAFLSYQAEGGKNVEDIQNALIAIELFHIFCLIHDDIIDEDDMRRGTQTVHARMGAYYAKMGRAQIAGRAGSAQALLVGDLVFAWVFELLAPYFVHEQVREEFLYTIDEVVIGQMIDVDLMAQSQATREGILDKMRLKTAGYTFVQPLRLGRLLAGKVLRDETLDAIGLALGLGFQMQDDLLDIYSTEAAMGKNIGSDIEESQHTLLTQFIIDSGAQKDIQELRSFMGQAMDSEKLTQLRSLFDRTGASDALRKDITFQMGEAQRLAQTLLWPEELRAPFAQLIAYVTNRTS